MVKELIACCGLDCEKCEARIATINNDNALREEVAKKWAEWNNSPEITADTINCTGCRGNGVKFAYCGYMCEIRKCVLKKGYDTCGDCPEMDSCQTVAQIHSNNEEAKNNLLQ